MPTDVLAPVVLALDDVVPAERERVAAVLTVLEPRAADVLNDLCRRERDARRKQARESA
jgi:hypothetical protein